MILDILIILIFALCVVRGVKLGFAKSVFGLFSFIVSIALAFSLYQPVSNFVRNSTYGQRIYEATKEKLVGQIDIKMPTILPGGAKEAALSVADTALENTALGISDMVINILSFVLLIVLIKLIFFVFSKTIDIVSKLPILKQANNLLGLVFGILNGGIIIMIVLALFASTMNLPWGNWFSNQLSHSSIAHVIYNNNILLSLLGK